MPVKNVGDTISTEIIKERKANGKFQNIEDFLKRVGHKDLNKKSLESLIKAGAFDNLTERGELLNNLDELLRFNQDIKKSEANPQINLFAKNMNFSPLKLKKSEPMPLEEKLKWERELLGLYLSDHPINRYQEKIQKITKLTIANIDEKLLNRTVRLGGIIGDIKKIVTKNGQAMLIARLEDVNNSIEITVFPRTLEKTMTVWQKDNIIIVEGKVNKNNGEIKIICEAAAIVK
jgi:DNA polymerase-3 subunit alpha